MLSDWAMRHLTDGERLRRIDGKIFRQRLLLGLERLWQVLHWPLLVAGIVFALVASGTLLKLPQLAQVATLAAGGAAFLFATLPLARLRWPTVREAMRHVEQHQALPHRHLSSIKDEVASELAHPASDALWHEHKRRQLAGLGRLRLRWPRSHWREFDQRALRVPVLMACLAAFFLGPNDFASNFRESTRLAPGEPTVPLTLDAWLKPPAYTGRPPLLLTSPLLQEKLLSGGAIDIPENAAFTLRLAGATEPSVSFLATDGAEPLTDIAAVTANRGSAFTAEAKISRPLTIVVSSGDKLLARWPITTIPDQPPALQLTENPSGDGRGNLTLKWKATDDYGVKKLSAAIELADEQEGGTGFESNGVFLYDAPELKVVLKRGNAKVEAGTSRFDLASHPWAGLMVTLSMTVSDGAEQTAKINPVAFKMPERIFVKALPRALIEQRRQLILYPERSVHIGRLIDMMALYPKGLVEQSGPLVAMGAIASRLRNAAGYDDVKLAVGELWDLAVALEEGSLADAKAELQALKEELERALREGAPPERIAELMKRLREAMNRYLDAMREEAERRMQQGEMQQQDGQQQGRQITREDLEKMFDALEELSKGGANDMAQQLLEELNQLLQNLEPGGSRDSANGQGEMDQMMQGLGDLMRRQQRLMDETQRMPGQDGDGQNGDQFGQGGQGSEGLDPNGSGDLSEKQRELRRLLDQLRGRSQGQLPDELGRAGEDMDSAADALRDSDRDGALQQQGEALDRLRKGARELAEQLRKQGQGEAEGQARDGEGRGGEDDPLGRPRATRNPDDGPREDMVPSERSLERARQILETLRAKANERGLSDSENSYIDRLLRGLF
jgi:uncharacterized protein (TIGR02302 family)